MTNQEIQDKIMEILKTKKYSEQMPMPILAEKIGCDKDTLEGNMQILRAQGFIEYKERPYIGIIDIQQGRLFKTYPFHQQEQQH